MNAYTNDEGPPKSPLSLLALFHCGSQRQMNACTNDECEMSNDGKHFWTDRIRKPAEAPPWR